MSGERIPERTVCAPDGSARFLVFRRSGGTYEVWLQKRETDPVYHPGEVWYRDVRDGAHFAATPDDAVRIGEEGLRALTGGGV